MNLNLPEGVELETGADVTGIVASLLRYQAVI